MSIAPTKACACAHPESTSAVSRNQSLVRFNGGRSIDMEGRSDQNMDQSDQGAAHVSSRMKISVWPIRRSKLSDQAASRLEVLIRDGTFPAGSVLPSERELMKIFGIGRTSIREALFMLHRAGLVQLSNGERPRVTTPMPEIVIRELAGAARSFLAQPGGVEHFQEARALFEVGVARLAALRRTDEDILRLRAAHEATIAARCDDARFERADVAFHYVLATITRNPIFIAVHDGFVEWLTSQRTVTMRVPGAVEVGLKEHSLILEGVQNGDADAAGQAMESHLRRVAEHFKLATESGV